MKAGLWFRRDRLVIVSPAREPSRPLSGRNATYPPVRIRRASSNGPIHTSKLTTKALAERPWLTVEWLPKYAPELNEIEHSWRDLKRHHLANRTFVDADDLDAAFDRAFGLDDDADDELDDADDELDDGLDDADDDL